MKEISLHILDIVQNSVEAGATRISITVTEDPAADTMTVAIADNGRGMPPELAATAADPFVTTRTTRRVGLGLPLLAATARQSGGELSVASVRGEGTTVTAVFGLSNIDRPPLGDMATTIACILAANPALDLEFRHKSATGDYVFRAAEFREEHGGESFSNPVVYGRVRDRIDAGVYEASGRRGIALP